MHAFRGDDLSTHERLRWLWLAGRVAQDLWDDESWEVLCTQHVRLARQTGALAVLPIALRSRIFQHGLLGRGGRRRGAHGEAETVSAAIGTQLAAYGSVALAALRGQEAETAELTAATLEDVESRGEGMGVGISHFTAALLYNGLGRYAEAQAEAEQACEHEDLGVISWALTELIEAAARCGRPEIATQALERLSLTAQAERHPWALGVHARSGRWSATATAPRSSTAKRSAASSAPACASSSPARTSSTANGYAGSAAGWRPASSCAPHTRC